MIRQINKKPNKDLLINFNIMLQNELLLIYMHKHEKRTNNQYSIFGFQ